MHACVCGLRYEECRAVPVFDMCEDMESDVYSLEFHSIPGLSYVVSLPCQLLPCDINSIVQEEPWGKEREED